MSEISEKEVEAAARALRPDAFRELKPMDLRSDDYALTNRQRAQEAARRSAQAALSAAARVRAEAAEGGEVARDERYPSVFYSPDRSQRIQVAQYQGHANLTFGILMSSGAWLEVELAPKEALQFGLHILSKPHVKALHPAPQPSGPVEALEAIRKLSRLDNVLSDGANAAVMSRMADIHQHADATLSALTAGKPEQAVPSGERNDG